MPPAFADFLAGAALAFPLVGAIMLMVLLVAKRGTAKREFERHKPHTWPASLIVIDAAVMALCLNMNRLDNAWWVSLAGAAAWSTISVALAFIYGRALSSSR